METTPYPDQGAWYQPMLDYGWGEYGTAADIVHGYFDFSKLRSIETKYELACRKLDRQKSRVNQLQEIHGWDLPTGGRVMCPVMLEVMLAVLPDDEPLPPRGVGGREPVPFDALLRAFILAPFYEVEDNSAAIFRALANNPRYLERCRFKDNEVPDVRRLQRFNEVMNWADLWGEVKRLVVKDNYETEALQPPRKLAIDPGHQDGYAGVRRPCAACRSCQFCDKEDRVRTCDVTDIVAKRKTYQFPGVKGVFVTDPDEEMPLMALAVNAREMEGRTGAKTARVFADEYPELVEGVKEVTLDGIFDIADEKVAISKALGGADVLTPINPGSRKPKPVKGARGIDHIDKYGLPHCINKLPMDYRGRDLKREDFIYGCPRFDPQTRTVNCPVQGSCCPNTGKTGRRFRVSRETTPQVDWNIPQHSADFKERYKARTAVERTIGRTKRSFPFERHWGRGRKSYQGHLDKGVLAFHVLMSAAAAAGRAEDGRCALTFHTRQEDDEAA